jgi:hypothetical protein
MMDHGRILEGRAAKGEERRTLEVGRTINDVRTIGRKVDD